ncbi:glycosyltransferase family 2 protein [Noviherbaspirillum pedocola]|uniref:Glycosyltransferase n=1 Tax=Noviherbaspirillum pedocola TaxID=2801341 RepID=A0A934SZ29_9BURK|nr:glycosyltransferase [Noviherbaspirillum pedocola]MBK4734378.1 glycosyltransferase [Noviherbaspirillum pedocola]
MMPTSLSSRLTVIILTFNRAVELRRTLERMLALPERPALIVVDNASIDGTDAMVRDAFPEVALIRLAQNIGAAARNAGVRQARTPYIAFCDDDTWWSPGSLPRAVALLEAHARIAVLSACILVGPEEREDPACMVMARSPLPSDGLPGRALLGFMAGASVMRRAAFIDAGGYEPKFFIGCEEALLTLDLIAAGWCVVYAPQLRVHHHPSPVRDRVKRNHYLARNALWVAWMRLPWRTALAETRRILRLPSTRPVLLPALGGALRELPWVLKRRRVIPGEAAYWFRRLHH